MSSWSALVSSLLSLLLGGTLAAMVAAWTWLVLQVRLHKTLLGSPVVRAVPWGIKTVAAAVVSWFALNLLVVLIYAAVTHRPRGLPFAFTEQMFLITVVNSAALVVIPLLVRLTSGATANELGLDVSTLKSSVRVGAFAFLIATWPVNLLHVLCTMLMRTHQKHPLEEMVRGGLDGSIAYLALLSAVVLAPAVEEILFRGIVQTWLTSTFHRWVKSANRDVEFEWIGDVPPRRTLLSDAFVTDWLPILMTSTIFALAHAAQWPAPIPIFVLSVVLGVVYQRTGSLFASFVLHALFNGFSTLLLFWALLHGGTPQAKPASPPHSTIVSRAESNIPEQTHKNRHSKIWPMVDFFGLAAPVNDWYIHGAPFPIAARCDLTRLSE